MPLGVLYSNAVHLSKHAVIINMKTFLLYNHIIYVSLIMLILLHVNI